MLIIGQAAHMSGYFFAVTNAKQLFGCSTTVPSKTGEKVKFTIQSATPGWPRRGSEGYGLLVTCEHPKEGMVHSFLKIFMYEVPERSQRTMFLTSMGLHKQHPWLFQGIPYASFNKFS